MTQKRRLFFDAAQTEIGSLPLENSGQSVDLNFLSAGTSFFNATITATRTVTLGKPFVNTFIHLPAVVVPDDATIEFNFLIKFNQSFPLLSLVTGAIDLPALSASTTVLSPALSSSNTVLLGAPATSAQVFNPSATTSSFIAPQHFGPTSVIFEPTVAPGAVTVELATIPSGATVPNPQIDAASEIALSLLASAVSVPQPTVSATSALDLPSIPSAAVIFEPSIVSAFISPGFLSSSVTVEQPQVSSTAYIAPEFLPGGAIFELVVTPGPVNIDLNAIGSAASVPSVLVEPGPVFVLPTAIGPVVTIFSPSVFGESRPSITPPYMLIRWRDDNREWSREVRIDLGNLGETEVVRQVNHLGMFTTRQYEFVVSENVAVSFGAAEEDIEVMT